MSEIKQNNNQPSKYQELNDFEKVCFMSKTKQENNQLSAYQELNDFELEIICGGVHADCTTENTKI